MKISIVGVVPRSLHNFRGPLIEALVSKGYEVYALGSNDLITFVSLFGCLARIRPDVIFTYTVKPNVYAQLCGWILGIPVRVAMVEGAGYALQEERSFSMVAKIVRALYRFSLRKAHRVIFLNSENLEGFKAQGMISDTSTVSILRGIGVSLDSFSFTPVVSAPSIVKYLFVGRLLNDKGVNEFLNAARLMKDRYDVAVQFEIVGKHDSTTDSVDMRKVEVSVENSVIMYSGHTESILEKYKQCHVFVLPSYHEGFPRSVMEAMSVGRPIITTSAVGCRDSIVDGVNGFIVEPGSVDQLVCAMEKFVQNHELIQVMGSESRRIAEERYDAISQNEKLAEMILAGVPE